MQLSLLIRQKTTDCSSIADGIFLRFFTTLLWVFGVARSLAKIGVAPAIWCLTVVIGRYVCGAERVLETPGDTDDDIRSASIVLLLTLGITLLHIWLFNQNPVQASFRNFLIPFLGSLAISSPFLQLTICRLSVIQDRDNKSTWSYVGSDLGFRQLQDMLKWSRVHVRIERVCPENLSQTFSAQYIVDQFYGQSPAVLKALSKYQFEGSLVLSRLAWCEMVLQRFPPEILSRGMFLKDVFYR